MSQPDRRDSHAVLETWRGSWKFLAVGLAILSYLVAIEHPHWFVLRPAAARVVAIASAANAPAQQNGAHKLAKP